MGTSLVRVRTCRAAALLLVLALVGCGDAGAPLDCSSGLLPDGELVIVPLTVSGNTVVVRLDGRTVAAIDSPPDLTSMSSAHRAAFSPRDTLWSTGFGPAGAVLTRSDDAGSTWTVVDVLPAELSGALDLYVDRSSEGRLTAWVAMAGIDGVATPGPRVFKRALDGDADWQQIPGIPETRFLGFDPVHASFGRRAGRLELLRRSVGEVALETLSGERSTLALAPDSAFSPADYTTVGDRGWIAGSMASGEHRVPAVLTIESDGAQQTRPIGDLDDGRASTIDFRDELHGFVCGATDVAAPFCAYSDDGGESWTLGEVPIALEGAMIDSVVRTGCDAGFAAWRARYSFQAGLLETRDGGRSWSRVALPELSPEIGVGQLARSSSAVDEGPPPRPGPPAPTPTRTSAPPPLAGDEPGPLVWLAAASVRGPGVTGLVLRSSDGGRSWSEVFAAPGGRLADVDFVDREVGWVVGARRILRTRDGGTSFVDQAANLALDQPVLWVDLIRAADRQHALLKVATGTGERPEIDTLLFTADGGATWQAATVPPWPFERDLSDVCLTRRGRGLLALGGRIFLSDDFGRTWIQGPLFPYTTQFGSGDGFGNPRLACSGEQDLWILVGSDPRGDTLWHSRNGGITWRELGAAIGQRPGTNSTVVGSFLDSGSAWLSVREQDRQALLFRSRDDGDSWEKLASPFRFVDHSPVSFALELPSALAFADETSGVALATSYGDGDPAGFLLVTADGGDSWERIAVPPDVVPIAISTVR